MIPEYLRIKDESSILDFNFDQIEPNQFNIESKDDIIPSQPQESDVIFNSELNSQVESIDANSNLDTEKNDNLESFENPDSFDETSSGNITEQYQQELIFRKNVKLKDVIYKGLNNLYQVGFDEENNLVAKSFDKNDLSALAISYNDELDQAKLTSENGKTYTINYFSEKVEEFRNKPPEIEENIEEMTDSTNSNLESIEFDLPNIINIQEELPNSIFEQLPFNDSSIDHSDSPIEQITETQLITDIADKISALDLERNPIPKPIIKTKTDIQKPELKPKVSKDQNTENKTINKPKKILEVERQNLSTPETINNYLNDLYDETIPVNSIAVTTDRIMGKNKLDLLKSKYLNK
jgi:hypothetical protein